MMGRRPSTLECLCLRGYTGNRCLSCAQKGDPLLISFVLSERDFVTFCIDWTALSHRSPRPCVAGCEQLLGPGQIKDTPGKGSCVTPYMLRKSRSFILVAKSSSQPVPSSAA